MGVDHQQTKNELEMRNDLENFAAIRLKGQIIISVLAVLGRFPVKLGPKTALDESASQNCADSTYIQATGPAKNNSNQKPLFDCQYAQNWDMGLTVGANQAEPPSRRSALSQRHHLCDGRSIIDLPISPTSPPLSFQSFYIFSRIRPDQRSPVTMLPKSGFRKKGGEAT